MNDTTAAPARAKAARPTQNRAGRATAAPKAAIPAPDEGVGTKIDAPTDVLIEQFDAQAKKIIGMLGMVLPDDDLLVHQRDHLVLIDHVRRIVDDTTWEFLSPNVDLTTPEWIDAITRMLEPVPALLRMVPAASVGNANAVLLGEAASAVVALREWVGALPDDDAERMLNRLGGNLPSTAPQGEAQATHEPVTRDTMFSIPEGIVSSGLCVAAWESESLLIAMFGMVEKAMEAETNPGLQAVQAMLRRLHSLNSLVMSCASQDTITLQEAFHRLAPSLESGKRRLPDGPLTGELWSYFDREVSYG